MSLPPEAAHNAAIFALKNGIAGEQKQYNSKYLKTNVFGLDFRNPVGIAAGFDKNAECIEGLQVQNLGFIEVGTVTPIAQSGNPKPRIFRFKNEEAIINRLGFNNKGLMLYSQRLRQWKYNSIIPKTSIIGANIGKNKKSKNDSSDYLTCMENVYGLCDYITVNISSPNTPGLRKMQGKEVLEELVKDVMEKRKDLAKKFSEKTPILIKISPDENDETLADIASICLKYKVDGVIISNTTVNKEGFNPDGFADKKPEGGLSGKPIFERSTIVLRNFYELTKGKIPLIGVGGVSSAEDAYVKIKAGASLVQVYSGFIYNGFGLANEINEGLVKLIKKDKYKNISEAVGAFNK